MDETFFSLQPAGAEKILFCNRVIKIPTCHLLSSFKEPRSSYAYESPPQIERERSSDVLFVLLDKKEQHRGGETK